VIPAGLTRQARNDWELLAAPTDAPVAVDPARLLELPKPVQRWLTHALPVGSPVLTSAELKLHGQIRLGSWRTFTAVQRSSVSNGFVWAATARLFGLPVVGFDRYTHGSGQLRWRLLNLFPVMAAAGSAVTRSAVGRHTAELLVAAPAVALATPVSWEPVDSDSATAHVTLDGYEHDVTVRVAASGALLELVMPRWGTPPGMSYGRHAFGAAFHDEGTFSGVTIPRQVRAGWHYGTDRWNDGEFIRWTVDDATYR
jgi:hypothetical protein